MSAVQKKIEQILDYIPKIPKEDSPSSVKLKAYHGDLKAFGVIDSYDLALDRIVLERDTETIRTRVNRAILFDAYKGSCFLYYNLQGKKYREPLNRFNPHRIPPGAPFVLKTNGSECHIILRAEELNG